MKKKLIYILCAAAVVAALGFTAAKISLPNAASGNTSSNISSDIFVTRSTTQKITETSSHKTTPAIASTNPTATIRQTEKLTTNRAEASVKAETTKSPTTVFPIQIPAIQIPTLKPAPAATTSAPSAEIDYSCFDNCAFVGNSRFTSFKNYGLAKNVYSVVGLNVDTVFTKSVSGSSVPVIDELNGKHFEKIILMFGDNECGWPNQEVFIQKYSKVIASVREKNPEAEIYLHAILPVSAEASDESQYGCNNPTINKLNEKIKQLAADEGVHFIGQPSCLKDSSGALKPDAASDGIHLNKKYSKIWLSSLAEEII